MKVTEKAAASTFLSCQAEGKTRGALLCWEFVNFSTSRSGQGETWRGHGEGMDARVEATQEQLPDGRPRIGHA
jgi:hypothetical protein